MHGWLVGKHHLYTSAGSYRATYYQVGTVVK